MAKPAAHKNRTIRNTVIQLVVIIGLIVMYALYEWVSYNKSIRQHTLPNSKNHTTVKHVPGQECVNSQKVL